MEYKSASSFAASHFSAVGRFRFISSTSEGQLAWKYLCSEYHNIMLKVLLICSVR